VDESLERNTALDVTHNAFNNGQIIIDRQIFESGRTIIFWNAFSFDHTAL
jgi:hypothetical protein